MKSLIILLIAVVAYSKADADVDARRACFDELKSLRACTGQSMNETIHKNMEQLKGFKEAMDKCFEKDGVKGVCTKPTPPPHPQWAKPAGGFQFPTPSPAVSSCIDGAKEAFATCFKREAQIPDGFKPEGGAQQQRRPPPPFFGHPHFPHDPKEMRAKVLESCGGNQDAVKLLEECAKEQMKPFAKALAPPMMIACEAAAACKLSHPISADCKAQFQRGRAAFCKCHDEFPKFVNTSSTCETARTTFKARQEAHEAAAQHVDDATAAHHDFPQHPHERLDFCGVNGGADAAQKHEDVCAKMQEHMQKAAQ